VENECSRFRTCVGIVALCRTNNWRELGCRECWKIVLHYKLTSRRNRSLTFILSRFGGKLVIEGDLSVGDLVAFMLYTTQIGASIGMMSGLVGSFFVAQGASKRSFQLIDREPKV